MMEWDGQSEQESWWERWLQKVPLWVWLVALFLFWMWVLMVATG